MEKFLVKSFEAPELEIVYFDAEDIITSSNELPAKPWGNEPTPANNWEE